MSQTITALIRTADQDWAAKYATPGPDRDAATITFPAEKAQPVTFAGRQFLRVDLKAICGRLPKDCLNRHVAIPDIHVLNRRA